MGEREASERVSSARSSECLPSERTHAPEMTVAFIISTLSVLARRGWGAFDFTCIFGRRPAPHNEDYGRWTTRDVTCSFRR